MATNDTLLQHALTYAREGHPVFPCHTNKTPWTRHWRTDATTDCEQITAWWMAHPTAMIAMPTGKESGIIAVDLDVDADHALDGVAAFKTLEPNDATPVSTRTHRTPRGGTHLLFAWPGVLVLNSASKIAPGVDVRGDGGYIIMPPSMSPRGSYSVAAPTAVSPAPKWLLALIAPPTATEKTASPALQRRRESIESIDAIGFGTPGGVKHVMNSLEVLRACLPNAAGEREICIMKLARGLKFNAAQPTAAGCKALVRQWHDEALPVIATKDFDTTWIAFHRAFKQAHTPLGEVLESAWQASQSTPFPNAAMQYDSNIMQSFVAFCFTLSKLNPGKPFYLGMDRAGQFLGGIPASRVSRMFDVLLGDGVLELAEKGNKRRATRYRWMATAV